ncbi:hypothetical protein [Aromatoleum buckelii]|uniref:Uncharacterized protein n=1 Tax=Aromatoleum buckelii TaxID=200254 RepID=A0ABX1N4A9_9RHOO|nr:hypothetical protein [Aromatoleum buckelii]MCK0511860.1 hypothetical protein [Aromatoleum buckelii]
MAAITVKDLLADFTLDRKTMSSVKGRGGASWVYGWISPYIGHAATRVGAVTNFYQTNNIFVADQINNQIQVIDIDNSAANAAINVAAAQTAVNFKG